MKGGASQGHLSLTEFSDANLHLVRLLTRNLSFELHGDLARADAKFLPTLPPCFARDQSLPTTGGRGLAEIQLSPRPDAVRRRTVRRRETILFFSSPSQRAAAGGWERPANGSGSTDRPTDDKVVIFRSRFLLPIFLLSIDRAFSFLSPGRVGGLTGSSFRSA